MPHLTRPPLEEKPVGMLLLAALLLAVPHRVYASNEASDDVAVIEDDALVARIPVGKRPRGLKLGPGGKLYVAVSGSPLRGPGHRDGDLSPAERAPGGMAGVAVARSDGWAGGFPWVPIPSRST